MSRRPDIHRPNQRFLARRVGGLLAIVGFVGLVGVLTIGAIQSGAYVSYRSAAAPNTAGLGAQQIALQPVQVAVPQRAAAALEAKQIAVQRGHVGALRRAPAGRAALPGGSAVSAAPAASSPSGTPAVGSSAADGAVGAVRGASSRTQLAAARGSSNAVAPTTSGAGQSSTSTVRLVSGQPQRAAQHAVPVVGAASPAHTVPVSSAAASVSQVPSAASDVGVSVAQSSTSAPPAVTSALSGSVQQSLTTANIAGASQVSSGAQTGGSPPADPFAGMALNSGLYDQSGHAVFAGEDIGGLGPLTGSVTCGGTFELVESVWRFNPNSQGAIDMYGSAQAASKATGVPLQNWWGDGPAPPGA